MAKIYEQKTGKLTEADWLTLAQLLIKAGYTVRKGRERKNTKSTAYIHFVEFTTEARGGKNDISD